MQTLLLLRSGLPCEGNPGAGRPCGSHNGTMHRLRSVRPGLFPGSQTNNGQSSCSAVPSCPGQCRYYGGTVVSRSFPRLETGPGCGCFASRRFPRRIRSCVWSGSGQPRISPDLQRRSRTDDDIDSVSRSCRVYTEVRRRTYSFPGSHTVSYGRDGEGAQNPVA